MSKIQLKNGSFGQFQKHLVEYVMHHLEESLNSSPLVYFPIINERVESFLLAHWATAWEECSHMTLEEWFQSECYILFKEEVLDDVIEDTKSIEVNGPEAFNEHKLV